MLWDKVKLHFVQILYFIQQIIQKIQEQKGANKNYLKI